MYLSRRSRFQKQYFKQRLLAYGLIGALAVIVVGFIFSFLIFAWYAKDLPSPSKLSSLSGYSTVFLDRDGKVLYDMYKDKNRVPVTFTEIPDYLKQATIAIEDKNFYKHAGISQFGILRAAINIVLGRGLQSGSTITQQLIKNVLLTSRRTIARKVQEMILAFEVERRYKKDEILLMYLNESPYGGTFWGVGTAAKGYFGKEVKDLNLVQSAIIAGLPQSPSFYSPFIGKNDAWRGRAKDVLRRMREDDYITRDQEKKALSDLEKIRFTAPKLAISAPHFVFYSKDQVEKEYGEKLIDQGIKVKTTLDLEVQKTAEKIVSEEIEKLKGLNATNGAVVVLDSKTGDILAMVGSYDYNDEKFGKFNAALGLRQPGSAVKPITYATALEKGYTPSMVLMDVKTEFSSGNSADKPYTPVNYDGKFRGPMQIRFTLGNSENIPAVKMLAIAGIRDFLQKATDMGMTTFAPTQENLNRFGLSVTLGGGETTLLDLTSAFSVFAGNGNKKERRVISEITDFKGKKIYKQVRVREKQVLTPEVAFLISHILSDNNARLEVFGPNSYLNIPGKTVAVKTGTTDDKRDNWAVGYTKSITVGVWVGNNDNSPMNPKIASGATGASPIFYRLMRELLKDHEDGIMDKPDKVKALTIDAYLGGLPKDGYPTRSEYFIEGTEPKDVSPFYKKLKLSKANGKLANDVEIKNGNFEEKEFVIITESDPVSGDGKNRWQEGIDAWLKDQGDPKFHPPTETSDASTDDVIISIKNPSGQQTVDSNNVEIKAKIISIAKIKNVKIKINGSEVKSIDGDKEEVNETINLVDGAYELQVVATNEKDKQGESTIKFGVNKPWDYITPTVIPSPTL
ncbi:MAG: Penicillin-binding protein, 1A family [Candidatus Roizmanbacteria bacterium GW2011_GWC2_37_13]|uniref:Penicillin-binding protein, 1A family n=1 Tax=Candidatus Roizmanbacteria bacterium GW2011_GWC2_37_13 TaxID=1618486 RepID=A0A0G0JC37_9BACT|nr:MAG: Penicillin-binding protein, 1A family [Candidatus Roizmanbacteria bacterium GW2011_GWC1_37_12]KKQ25711.1 MAG: Penicillin-binding protein, 1A family [Candidatus Roizmanbacteria bacterium GW2011_GWC2_37_13]